MGTIPGSGVVLIFLLMAPGRAKIQQPGSAEGLEGAELNLTCSHPSIKTNENVVWYRQFPNQGPQYIVSGFRETTHSTDPEGALHVSGDRKSSALALRRVRLAGAALYYCALSPHTGTLWKLVFGSGTKLLVTPDLTDSDPSVYQLKSQDGNFSACLFTDFAPENISVGSSHNALTQVSGSIVQVKNPDSGKTEASYGTVLWREEQSLHCFAEHKTESFNMDNSDEEGDTCGMIEMHDNFETDEKLNLLSFTLLGLRIVFVKGVAVNLLLTIWLWKS